MPIFNNLGWLFGYPPLGRINANTIPVANVQVNTDNVVLELPNHAFYGREYVGGFFLNLRTAIPAGTTATLPILIGTNGDTRPLMETEGTPVTVANITGAGIYEIHYNRYTNELYLVNAGYRPAAAAAATANARQAAPAAQEAAAANFDDFRK